jgi:hypothetical protein
MKPASPESITAFGNMDFGSAHPGRLVRTRGKNIAELGQARVRWRAMSGLACGEFLQACSDFSVALK